MHVPSISFQFASYFNRPVSSSKAKPAELPFKPHTEPPTAIGVWYRLKDRIVNPTELGQKIRNYATNPSLDEELHRDFQTFTKTMISAFDSPEYPQLQHFIAKTFNRLSDQQLNELLKALFLAHAEKNSLQLIKKLKGLFTLQKIENLIKVEFPNFTTCDGVISGLAKKKGPQFEKAKSDADNTLKRTAKLYLINTLDFVVNTTMYIFQVKNFFEYDDMGFAQQDNYQAQMKYQAFRDNCAMITGWLLALSLYTKSVVLTILVAGTAGLALLATAVIYFKWFKPCPDKIPYCQNLVSEAIKGNLPSVYCREKEIDALIDALCSNNDAVRKLTMLLGPSGAGKTEIVNGLAHRIAEGKVPDQLKGKKLFSINTKKLVSEARGPFPDRLDVISRTIEGYEDDAIFFFDEFQSAFNEDKSKDLSQDFKTLFNRGSKKFKRCIAATTQIEYDAFVAKDAAIVRRLHHIQINPMNDIQTQVVLSKFVLAEGSDLIVDQEAIELVAKIRQNEEAVFENCAQPDTSLAILSLAFTKARTAKSLEQEEELRRLEIEKSKLECLDQIAYGANSLSYSNIGQERERLLADVIKRIHKINDEILEATAVSKAFSTLVQMRKMVKDKLERASIMLAKKSNQDTQKDFILEYHFLQNAINEAVQAQSNLLKIASLRVDVPLIKAVIEEEKARRGSKKL